MSLVVDKVNHLMKENVTVKVVVVNHPPVPHVIAIAWLNDNFYLATEISKSDIKTGKFDREQGIEIAKNKVLNSAKNKLFELEAYHLYSTINNDKDKSNIEEDHLSIDGRLRAEHESLKLKISKLESFIKKGKPDNIPHEHFLLLNHQLEHMEKYSSILDERIKLRLEMKDNV